ncbi:TPA: hypothetical protein ACH3X2_002754 [Trebouxia sp. C0005]
MERCQQAEVRCTAMQQTYVLVQSGKAGNKRLSQLADNQASVSNIQGGYKVSDMATHTQTRPVEVSEAIKAYRQLPTVTDFSATPVLVASAGMPDASQAVSTADVLKATAATEAPQPAQMLTPQDTAQTAAVQSTVPLSEVPANVQQMLLSDSDHTNQARLLSASAISQPADADDIEGPVNQSSAAVPLLASQQGTVETVQSSNASQNQMRNISASPVLQTCLTAPDSFHLDGTVHINSGVPSVSEARGAAASLYEHVMPQDSFASASGFYSPRSQMASRRQSASSSDAWYDATSQMTSRTPSVTAPAPSASLPSSQSTGSSFRGVQGRLSTKDLIGDLRKRQGLPSADAAPIQVAVQQVTTVTHHPAAIFQASPMTAAQQAPGSAVVVQPLPQQSTIAADASYGLSLEASEAHATSQHPQGGEAVSVVAAGQPVMPQSALLELVSNPLYAKSLDASRTTSTSPTRLDTSTLVKQAELGAEDSDIPIDSSLLQVSDQPILPESETSQATMEPMVASHPAELHLSEKPLASPMAVAHGIADAPESAMDNTAMLQVSDQPILSTVTAASAAIQCEAAVEQFSNQPLLPTQTTQQTVLVSEQHDDISIMGLPEAGTGQIVAVSGEPILSLAAGSISEAVQAEPVPVLSSQPMLGPVLTHAESSARPQPLSLQQRLAAEPQQQVQQLMTVQTAQLQAEPLPEMSSQPLLAVVSIEHETKQLLDQPEAESVAAMSSEPVLGSVISHTESSLTQQVVQETLMQTTELQHAATKPVANATVRAEQTDANAEGLMLRPPLPALPSVRRSRSSLQSQSSSVRRSVSVLPAVPEAPQLPQRSSPVPQLRRSVTSLTASPVPVFDQSLVAPKAEPQQALAQQTPVMMPAPFMPQAPAPLGPLQQGMPAPSLTQAHNRGLALPTSSASMVVAPPVPAMPVAPAPTISPQQVQVAVPAAPLQAQQAGQLQAETLRPLPPSLVQESRSFESVSPQQSPGAISIDQAAPVLMSAERSADLPMQQQASYAVQSLETSYPQMVQTASVQQLPPVFMSSIDAGFQQQAAPPPVPMPAPRAYSPTQFLRSNTWSPSPGVLQPAKPGQAVAAPQVHGPLSMGVQPSWNSLAPSQPPPVMVSQLAIEQEAYARAQPIASAAAAQQVITSRDFSPVTAPASRAMYQQPGQIRQQQGPVSRQLYQQSSLPSPEALRAAAAATSREVYPQLGPLTGGLTQPGFPVRRELYQQVSLPSSASMHAAAHSREMFPQLGPLSGGLSQQTLIPGQRPNYQVSLPMADPRLGVTAHGGAVIQPVKGPVVVGEQSAAVTTEPLVMHSQGYSIQPLQSVVAPSGGMQQMARDLHPNASRSNGLAQVQFGVLQQTGGVHAKRALEAFGRVSRSSLNADASVNNSYQSDRDMQQGYTNEPQPAQRAESPPTPAVPPVSYFLNTEPVVTSYITPLPQPVAMPGPPAFSMVPGYPGPGQTQVGATPPRRSGRGPAFPAHLRSAVTSMQNPTSVVQPVSSAQWATNAPPVVLPRVAVAAPPPTTPRPTHGALQTALSCRHTISSRAASSLTVSKLVALRTALANSASCLISALHRTARAHRACQTGVCPGSWKRPGLEGSHSSRDPGRHPPCRRLLHLPHQEGAVLSCRGWQGSGSHRHPMP